MNALILIGIMITVITIDTVWRPNLEWTDDKHLYLFYGTDERKYKRIL